jgi:hypothetical protein
LAEATKIRDRSGRVFLLPKGTAVVPVISTKSDSFALGWLNVACLLHAILITVLWILDFKFNIHILSAKIWLAIALMWLLWIPGAALFRPRKLKDSLITGIAGILILMPTYSTLYTFTVWAAGGFAP